MWLTRLTRSGARAAIVPRGMRHVRSSHAVVDRWDSLERNLNFVLYDVLPGRDLCKKERFAAHDQSTFDAFLKTTINIAAKELAPLNHFVDANEPAYVNGEAKVPQPVHQAVKAMADSGYIASLSSVELGGLQLPYVVATACTYALQTASVGIASYLMLTHAAAHLLAVHGSEDQVATFVPPMLEGRFTGTMCLSEPQAGSSLADITTTATPVDAASGVYSITGNKMWISGGDQDITENIVHLVLARIKGAPAGVKGISLFIVPKFLVKPDGSIGQRNDVALMGLNHKMGWRGTTNTALSFGENGQCTGYLIGKANHGLSYMFTMMNEARVGVGVCATALGTAGYYHSLEYATTRTQGRSATSRDPTQPQIPIIEHSDVKRMLVVQKAYTEGAMALCLYVAHLVDVVKCEEADSSEYVKATMLLDLLTPIVKSWPSEWCLEANKWAIQIFGGYGYTRDYPVEQCYRDNRLNMIHEGTNGIQALDLLGRKVGQHSGKALKLLAAEITATAQQAPAELKEHADALLKAVGTVGQTTQMLLEQGGRGNVDLMLANSHEYLNMFGNTIIAWMWLKQANAASSLLADPAAAKESADFYRGKLNACRFFFRHELPKVHLQAKLLQSLDDTILQVEPAGL